MTPKQTAPTPPPMLALRDIYYILFRHKLLAGAIASVAVIIALLVYLFYPVVYTSEARLMIKYVVDTKPLAEAGSDAQVTALNQGDAILNAEVDMLTSFDVAKEAAAAVGPAKILAKTTQGTNLLQAAMMIQNNLLTDPSRRGQDIRIIFSHRDPDLVEPILNGIITAYENEHAEVRRPKSADALQPGVDQLNAKLKEAEENLETERTNVGIVAPVEDSKRTAGERIARTEAELDDVMVNLQAETATIKAMKKAMGAPTVVVTNAPVAPAETPAPQRDVVDQYNTVCVLLTSLRSKEQDLLSWTTTNNLLVQQTQKEIANTETQRKLLEKQNPGLLAIKTQQTASAVSSAPQVLDPLAALNLETIKLDALQARYQILTNLLTTEKATATKIEANESRLVDLEDESKQYRATVNSYRQRQGEAQLNDVLGPGSSEINIIEKPTPPVGNIAAVKKIYGGVLLGGLALALGLPFLIELYLDQTLKRPSDVKNKLGVPFFVSMPRIKANAKRAALQAEKKVSLLPENAGEIPPPEASAPASPAAPQSNGHIAPWDQRHALRPFFETLRDRLMTYFEVINLTHKPKLVAVSSCSEGAGVTTTAAGLASALSETGDGNVLLVNMNVRDGEAHHFYRGKLTCGLEEALEKNTRNAACIQENLFIAKDFGDNENVQRVLPKRFSHLVPKMRASDYDYIIFDMPAMSQISITPRLARYMDMVLLVIESEKTDRDAAKRATNLLLESKSNVGVVLNKCRDYLPRSLQQDI